MKIICGSYQVFGSGSAWASLRIDGQKVSGYIDMGNNGFVGWYAADVPVQQMLAAKKVVWEKGAYPPGGQTKFETTGRGFIRRYFADNKIDELRIPLMFRKAGQKFRRNREISAWVATMLAQKEAGTLQFRRIPARYEGMETLESRTVENVKLPDGSAGKKYSQWKKVSGPFWIHLPHSISVILLEG